MIVIGVWWYDPASHISFANRTKWHTLSVSEASLVSCPAHPH